MIKIAVAFAVIIAFRFLVKWVMARRRAKKEQQWQQQYEAHVARKQGTADQEMVVPRQPVRQQSTRTLIERSWEFLARIADHVTKAFSPADKKKLFQLGNILAECEMVYRHDPGLSQTQVVPSSNVVAPGFEKKAEKDGDSGKQ